jgi:peptidyl-prolyl cis-trans isomerase SurA
LATLRQRRFAEHEEHGLNSNLRRGRLVAIASLLAATLFLLSGAGCNTQKDMTGVMATVNGRKVLRTEVDKYYNNQTASAPQKPTEEQADNLRLNILRGLIDNEILMQRAEKIGMLTTDDDVNIKLTETKAPYTQEEFDKHLKDVGLTLDDVKRNIREQLTIQKVLNREIVSKIDVTDDDITSYYNQHKAEFNFIETQYRLALIVVTTTPSPQAKGSDKAQNEPEARRKIQMIYNRLESGEDFATDAMKYSEQPETAQNGGDLGFIPESSLRANKASFDLISKLTPGRYSPVLPVIDPNSRQVAEYRIVKLLAKEPAGQRELKDPRVQQLIREQLRDRREQLLKAAYYEVIRDEAKVENFFAQEILKKAGTTK